MGDFNPDLFVPVTSVTQMWGGAIIKSILTTFRLTWESTILLWRKSYCLLGPESISKGWTAFTETGPIYEDLEREEDVEMEVLSSSDAFCLKNQCWPSTYWSEWNESGYLWNQEFVYHVCPRDWSVSQWCQGAEGVTQPPVNGLKEDEGEGRRTGISA